MEMVDPMVGDYRRVTSIVHQSVRVTLSSSVATCYYKLADAVSSALTSRWGEDPEATSRRAFSVRICHPYLRSRAAEQWGGP